MDEVRHVLDLYSRHGAILAREQLIWRHITALGLRRAEDFAGVPAVRRLRQLVDGGGGEAERLANLADGKPGAERDDVGHHPGPLLAVLLVDVLDHLLAAAGGKVDIDVRSRLLPFVEEAVEA